MSCRQWKRWKNICIGKEESKKSFRTHIIRREFPSFMIKLYYPLTKPGIIFGNAVTTAAGFMLASRGSFDFSLFFWTLVGLCCVIASACVCNNCIDHKSDAKMARTKNRALAQGSVSIKNALLFATCMGATGTIILAYYTNYLTLAIALAGFFVYVVLYSFWKYRSSFATVIGSISGAIPPVVGYCAVSNRFDMGACLIFMIVALWQMPHFFAIAVYRLEDYKAASIPVLPLEKGLLLTKIQMVLYTIAFIGVSSLLTVFGYTGYIYLGVILGVSLIWLKIILEGFTTLNDTIWAKKVFIGSLVVIMAVSIMISVDVVPVQV